MSRELEATDLAFKPELQSPAEILKRARWEIAKAQALVEKKLEDVEGGKKEERITEFDYGTLFKDSTPADMTKMVHRPIYQRAAKRQKILVTLEDIFQGKEKPCRVVVDRLCSQCNGKRTLEDKDLTCPTCSGAGQINQLNGSLGFATPYQRSMRCGTCAGEGVVVPPDVACWQCLGAGLLGEPIVFQVQIPLGVIDLKSPIILAQQGDASLKAGEAAGDLEFMLELVDHPYWALVGNLFYCVKEIPILDAIQGKSFELSLCNGEKKTCFSKTIMQDNQIMCLTESRVLIRIKYIYPEKVVNLYEYCEANPVISLPDEESRSLLEPAKESVEGYFIRHWGNRKTVLKPLP